MKRMLATLMVLSLSLALLAGCGSQGNTSGSGETGDTIVFKVAHVESSESFLHQSLVKWKEYVETETNGRVKVELYPNGELGGDDEVIEGIRMQNIHMSICSSSTLTTYDEKLGLLDLPFLFESVEGMDAAIRGELGDLYAQWMDAAGFYCMGFQYDGSRGLSNSVRPVSTPDDMKGLKVRVMQNEIYINTFKALGANPTPMSFNDVYSGLQQKTIDGQDNSPMLTYINNFYEVQPYYSTLGHVICNAIIITDKAFMESLPADILEILQTGADTYLMDWQRQQAMDAEEDYIQKMIDGGVSVTRIEDKTPFIDAVQSVYDIYRDRLGDEVIDQLISLARGTN